MDKAFLPLSEEVLAAAFNISSEEYSTLFEEKDGEKSPVSEQKIKSMLLSKLGNRIDSVVSEKTASIEKEAEAKHKRLAYKDIEDKAKEMYGVDMRWSEDGFNKIADKLSKGKKADPVDIERSEQFQSMVKSYEDKLQDLSTNHTEQLYKVKQDTTTRTLTSELFNFFKGKENELALPPNDDVLKRQIEIMIERDLYGGDKRVEYVEGKATIVDKEGKPVIDKENGYQPLNFESYITNVAKQGYFPELITPKISSPNPAGGSNNGAFDLEINGNKKSYSIPQFNNIEDLGKWTMDVQSKYSPQESAALIKEANKQLEAMEA